MDTTRPCGCKGRRSCLSCEEQYNITPTPFLNASQRTNSYVYCPYCNKAWPGWDEGQISIHPNHSGEGILYPGVYIELNFLSEKDKYNLLEGIDNEVWDTSQSGRRKQNYGPKCNFKKNKIQVGDFKGFPAFSRFVQERFGKVDILKEYQVIEQCSLEYTSDKGACIDPHIDDCWVWGERIVTVNVLGDSVLTMTKYQGETKRYNLNQVPSYPKVLDDSGLVTADKKCYIPDTLSSDISVRIFMPEKSLLVLYGPARYDWEHCVLREDVSGRRVCLAYREFTPPFLQGGKQVNIGSSVVEISKQFF